MATDDRPPQPKSILRGHKASIHAAAFVRANERLLTGDADGFVVAWDLTIMRPRAVWRAHTNAILGLDSWGHDRIITYVGCSGYLPFIIATKAKAGTGGTTSS